MDNDAPLKESEENTFESFPVKQHEPKLENMDDSGFGTCSSATTTVDENSESVTIDETPRSDTMNTEEANSNNDFSSDKLAIECLNKVDLPSASKSIEEVDRSTGDNNKEDLLTILKKDFSEKQESMTVENGDQQMSTDEKPTSLFKKRQCKIKSKRRKEDGEMEGDSPDHESDGSEAKDSSPTNPKKAKTGEETNESESDEFVDARDNLEEKVKRKWSEASSSSLSSPSDSSDVENNEENKEAKEEEEKMWLQKDISDLPNPKWRAVAQLRQRQYSLSTRYWPYKVCGSIDMVKRFELQHELVKHEGCVNALHMNQSGTLLASGSDDLNIILWDWWSKKGGRPVVNYESGHRSNVFQVKFMPESGDATVVSTARDGQVRVANISSTGTCTSTKKIAQHRGSAHKLALDVGSKATFLSCGEDGVVFGIDLRMDKPASKLVTVKTGSKKVPLYSIHTNPSRPAEFAVSGRDTKAHIFDRRMIDNEANLPTVKTYCPQHLQDAQNVKANITCLVYNWDGSEILCSYNDEDIYLFDTSHSEGADYIKRYKGHRNNATVKGVNFYGPHSEFVVSGSDCGNIFFWEKQSSRIVHLMEGDKGGVVNVLEPHPALPILATSGLDHEVKIWSPSVPSNSEVSKITELKELMLSNRRDREEEMRSMTDMIDGQMLWFLMRTLRNRTRRAAERREQNEDSSSDSELSDSTTTSSSSEELGDNYREPRCIQS